MKPLISVILPVHKTEPIYFKNSLDSILQQEYNNIEIIVIFDKSDDPDLDDSILGILNELRDDKRLRVVQRPKLGFTSALNKGLALARGEYIARMDADDISEKERLGSQYEFIKDESTNLIGTWAYVIQNDRVIGKIMPPTTHEDIRKKIMLHNPLIHTSLLVERNVFRTVGNYDPVYEGAEDYELYVRALANGFRISNVPKFLVSVRETPSSIMRGAAWKKARSAYIRTKMRATTHYRMNNFCDMIYVVFSFLSYCIPPSFSIKAKEIVGWYRPMND